jgi:pimeloyl-ACP methyl ester carboxylesterase
VPFVPTLGGRVFARHAGSGPDLLLIGGVLDDATTWQPHARALAHRFRVTTFDPRSVGQSTTPIGPYTVGELADDALAVLDHVGAASAHVVGVSLGGLVAQRLAARHPERVRSLVLGGSWARSDRYLRALLRSWTVAAERARSLEELLGSVELWTRTRGAWNEGVIDEELAHEERTFPEVAFRLVREGFIATVSAAFDDQDLAAVEQPALVLRGEDDRVVSEALARDLADRLDDARFETIARAGHAAHLDAPDAFVDALQDFLALSPAPVR